MNCLTPTPVLLTAWLNAWRFGHLTLQDASHACTDVTNCATLQTPWGQLPWLEALSRLPAHSQPLVPALPRPGMPSGLPSGLRNNRWTGAIAWDLDHVLASDAEGVWHYVKQQHSITPIDLNWARENLLKLINHSVEILQQLQVLPHNDVDIKSKDVSSYWPPSLAQRNRYAIDQAIQILQITNVAMDSTQVIASRSNDNVRIQVLRELQVSATALLCAAVSQP